MPAASMNNANADQIVSALQAALRLIAAGGLTATEAQRIAHEALTKPR